MYAIVCNLYKLYVWTPPVRAGGRWGGILTATRVLLVSLCASSPHPIAERLHQSLHICAWGIHPLRFMCCCLPQVW